MYVEPFRFDHTSGNCLRFRFDDRVAQPVQFTAEFGRRIRASHIGGVAFYGPTAINQHKFLRLYFSCSGSEMEHRRVGTAADRGVVAHRIRSGTKHGALKLDLNFALGNAWFDHARYCHVSGLCRYYRATDESKLVLILAS